MATTENKPAKPAQPAAATKPARSGSASSEIDLVALFIRFLEKIHWIILTALLGAVIAGLIVYFLVTPIYQATAKIYIVGSDTAISLSDLQIGTNLAADYGEVFKTWHVHELVDRRLDLNYSYAKLSSMITVTNPAGTHVLYIQAKSPDPQEAKLLADTYAQVAREFIAVKMDMREPNVFEEAMEPTAPVSPSKTRDIVMGFLLGALLAMAVITVKFLSDDRICTGEDIAKVGGLTTLGMIPLEDMTKNASSGAPSSAYGRRKGE